MREEPLPANPNCVSFATDAGSLFSGRSWAELQQLAIAVGGPFHDASQLPTLAGYAWRVALDRKNERSSQGQLFFVFDGPATSAHLDQLESAAGTCGVGFGAATVERAPPNGAAAVYLFGGRAHGVWSKDEAAGEPQMRKLVVTPSHVSVRVAPTTVRLSDSVPDDQLVDLPQVIGIPAPYSESERELERMRIAFALRWIDRIVRADGVVRDDEQSFVRDLFPEELLRRLGLDEASAVEEYFTEACDTLPVHLGHHDKLALVGLFFSACSSDGSIDPREMRVLREGGEALGLSREQVVKYLQRFW
ncbi:MAG: TerB family tellurite resistance protein [Myxococcota bacterium]